jgi:hypothetical protein
MPFVIFHLQKTHSPNQLESKNSKTVQSMENEEHQKESSGYLPSTSHARKMAQK